MKKRLFLLVLVAVVTTCMLVPGSAFAKSKISPNVRGVRYSYVTTVATPTVTISGRLLYRKIVVKSGKRVKVDAPIPGHINLYRRNDRSYRLDRVGTSQLVNGAFSFHGVRSGYYLIRFGGTKGIKAREVETIVEADLVSITNLHAVSASVLPTSGDIFVKLSADVDAPAGVITTATPALELMYFRNASSARPAVFFVGPFAGLVEQLITHAGTYQTGCTIGAGDKDKVLSVSCTVYPLNRWSVEHSVVATFMPSDLLP